MTIGKVVKQKLDLVKAKKYCPPNCFFFHSQSEHRIRGYLHVPNNSTDRPNHGCTLAVTQDVAIRVVLEWLWMEHHRRNPHLPIMWEFPYTLPEM
jgi:hypothetical protein